MSKELKINENFKTIANSSIDCIYQVDNAGKFIFVNDSFSELFGYKKDELIGKNFASLLDSETIPKVKKMVKDVLSGKKIKNEVPVRHKDGHEIFVNFSATPLRKQKKIVGLTGILRDITERKKAEEELKQNEEKYRKLVENIPEVIYHSEIGKSSKLVFLSKNMEKITGYPTENFLSDWHFWSKLIHPEDHERVDKEMKESIKNKSKFECEYRLRKKNGNYLNVIDIAKPIKSKKGDVQSFQGLLIDITERKKMEEALRESEEKYRNLFENANDGIIYIDKWGKIIDVNQKSLQIFGGSKKELLGKRFTKIGLFSLMDIAKLTNNFVDIIKGKTVTTTVNFKNKNGRMIFLECSSSIIKKDKKIINIMVIARDVTKRKKAEEKIKKSEEKYRSLIINIPDVTWTTDFKGNTVFISPNIKRIYGYTQQEIYEKGDKVWFNRIHLDDVEKVKDTYKKLFENGKQFDVEYRIKKKDGKWIWLRDRSIATYRKDGILYADGIFSDITERKKAEEELKEKENRYRTLVENLPQKVFLKDKNSVYVSCNDNYAKDLKIKPEEIIGKIDFEFYPKELAKKYRVDDNRIMKSGKTEDIEERYVQDGQENWVHTIKIPVKDEKGNIVGILGIFWNITEQKKAQEELKASEARYRSYIEATKQLGWTTDPKGLIIEDIPTWRAYTGQSFEKIKNWGWIKAIHPDDAKHTAEVWKKAVKTKSIYETEYRIRGKDEKYKWFLARGIPVLKEDGSIREWVGICIDISERIKIEEEIKKARDELQSKVKELTKTKTTLLNMMEDLDETNKKLTGSEKQLKTNFRELKKLDIEKDEFISIAAHELKTPMSAIIGFSQLLVDKKIEDTKTKNHYLKIIEGEAKRLSKLVTGILDLSRMDLGSLKFYIEEVDVYKVMEDIKLQMAIIAQQKGLKLELNVDDNLPKINADKEKIKEILVNLIDNSIKYTEKGDIKVGVHAENNNIKFSVTDTGIGIPKEQTDKIFRRFYQVNSHLTRKVGGTGLGLSICKGLVEAMNGRIWFESELGKGSTFSFLLPIKPSLLSKGEKEIKMIKKEMSIE